MKRFWDKAAAAPQPGGFGVVLDGKPVRLPGGDPLVVGTASLAEAIAAEWDAAGGGARGGEMTMADVPLTRLAGTAQERIAPDPAPMVEGLAKYAETDLLCYRATDPKLAARQAEEWQPLLDWAALQHDAPLRVTEGLMPVPQDPWRWPPCAAVAACSPLELAALGVLVPSFGSLVLALAVVRGRRRRRRRTGWRSSTRPSRRNSGASTARRRRGAAGSPGCRVGGTAISLAGEAA